MLTNIAVLLGTLTGAAGIILANADPGSPINMPLQYGALGLLGFMLWVQSKERKGMAAAIDTKDKSFVELFEKTLDAVKQITEAVERCDANQKGKR